MARMHRIFGVEEFAVAQRAAEHGEGTHRQLWVARCDATGVVELRVSDLTTPPTMAEPALRFTTEAFDRYQLRARRGMTIEPLQIDDIEDDAGERSWRLCNAEDPDSGSIVSDPSGHLAFLDGVFRGEWGGPDEGVTSGLHDGSPCSIRSSEEAAHQ